MKNAIGRNEVIVLAGLLAVTIAIYLLVGPAWALLFVGIVLVAIGAAFEWAASRG